MPSSGMRSIVGQSAASAPTSLERMVVGQQANQTRRFMHQIGAWIKGVPSTIVMIEGDLLFFKEL